MLCSTQRGQDRGMHWRLDDNPGDLSSSSHFPKTPLHGQNPLSLTIFPVCWVISGLPDFRGRSRLRVLVVRTVAPSALSGQQELLPKGSVSWLK